MKRAVAVLVGVVAAVAACAGDDDTTTVETAVGAGATVASTGTGAPAPSAPDVPTTATGAPTSTAPATSGGAATVPATPRPVVDPAVTLTEVASLDAPVDLAWREGDDALYLAEQPGRVVRLGADGSTSTVLDITELTEREGEQGLLGLAFAPAGDVAYVNYTDDDGDTVIAAHRVGDDGAFATGDGARTVLQIDQPYPNHNGGDLLFGPDGLLYIAMGDGGSGGDPERRALDPTSLLGKILRIDPAGTDGQPYAIPADNPLVGDDGAAPEIWTSGLRNPWRVSFDRRTGDMWIGDVGQNAVEEIDVAPATGGRDAGRGLSFGWSAFEGDERYNDDVPAEGHVAPIFTYGHDTGCSVSGGVRVRGGPVGALEGWYVFADYCSGQVRALEVLGEGAGLAAGRVVELGRSESVTAVVDGPGGEVYVLSAAGPVLRLDPA